MSSKILNEESAATTGVSTAAQVRANTGPLRMTLLDLVLERAAARGRPDARRTHQQGA